MSDEAQLETLTAEDIGLPANARIPLRFTPGHTWSPLVISFPHVGLAWPHDLRPKPQVDFARNADYEVQTLYRDVAQLGVATVAAVYSRLVVDLNRAPDDVPAQLVPDHPAPRPRRKPGEPSSDASADGSYDPRYDAREHWDRPGRGVVWASAVSSGAGASIRILEPPLPYRAFAHRIERYHAPYYAALSILLERRRRRFGYAVLLDAHSMPSSVGLDLVLGTLDGESASDELAADALAALAGPVAAGDRDQGPPGLVGGAPAMLSIKRDHPYRGGELVRRFGRPAEGLHAFQLEVSRRLYMDEQTYSLHGTGGEALEPSPESNASGAGRTNPHHVSRNADELRRSVIADTPARRGARELAELLRRVRCLVGRLAAVGEPRLEGAVARARVATVTAEPASR
jgi:N-formylglutamate amidohydrolase